MFRENGLESMLEQCFNKSPYTAINSIYPDKFKEWEFKKVPKDYWNNKENGIRATKWLIEEKLKLSDEELKERLTHDLFRDNGLAGMLKSCFNDSAYNAINSVYPNKFKEWEFKQVPKGYWKDTKNLINATKWLIEEKLKLSDEELKEQLSRKLFIDNGLNGMVSAYFKNSAYDAINLAYPNKFKKSDFKGYRNNNQ